MAVRWAVLTVPATRQIGCGTVRCRLSGTDDERLPQIGNARERLRLSPSGGKTAARLSGGRSPQTAHRNATGYGEIGMGANLPSIGGRNAKQLRHVSGDGGGRLAGTSEPLTGPDGLPESLLAEIIGSGRWR